MPIRYDVYNDGHAVHAVASDIVKSDEFIEYEVAHATDQRVKPPVSELFEIEHGALREITMDDMTKVLERRSELERLHTPHRCAIVVSYGDTHDWNLAEFYEDMAMLHSPESVIVFGDAGTARIWLGLDGLQPNKRMDSDKQ
jgi:hypothetical protein